MLNYECFNMSDVIVYSFLRECCHFNGHENAKTQVSNEKLSQLSGLSLSTVKRSLNNLKKYKIISVDSKGVHSRSMSLLIDFLDIDFAKYLQDELKLKKIAENENKYQELGDNIKNIIRELKITDLSFLDKEINIKMTRSEIENWLPELTYLFCKFGASKKEQNKNISLFLEAGNPYEFAKNKVEENGSIIGIHEVEKIGIGKYVVYILITGNRIELK